MLARKGNQGTAPEEIKAYLDDAVARQAPELAVWETVAKGHGRLETRRHWQSEASGWFADRAGWPGRRSVGLVEATRELGDQVSVERRYHLSSLPQDAAQFAKVVRGHWAIENQCHWVLDVVFREDQSRARTGPAGANLGRQDKSLARGTRRQQLHAALNPAYLRKIRKI